MATYNEIARELRKYDSGLAKEAAAAINNLTDDVKRAEAEIQRLRKNRDVVIASSLETLLERTETLIAKTDQVFLALEAIRAEKPATTRKTSAKGGSKAAKEAKEPADAEKV